MKYELPCEIVEDLLPSYVDGLTNTVTTEAVDEHLKTCPSCQKHRDAMMAKLGTTSELDDGQLFRKINKRMRKHIISLMIFTAFACVWAGVLVWGLFFLKDGEELGFVVLTLYMIMPLTAFVCSLLLGLERSWIKWLAIPVFGLAGLLLPAVIFGTWDIMGVILSAVPALAGFLIGSIVSWAKKKFRK